MDITVGPAKDYTTMQAALAYLASIDPLSEDTNVIVEGDTVEVTNNTYAINLGGYALKIYSNLPPVGDPTAGHALSISGAASKAVGIQAQGAGTLEVFGLKVVGTGSNNSMQAYEVSSTGPDVQVHDCMTDMSAATGLACSAFLLSAPSATPSFEVWNMTLVAPATASSVGFRVYNSYAAAVTLENLTVQGGERGIDLTGSSTDVRDCAAFGALDVAYFGIGNADGYNNGSDDGSGDDGNWSTGSGNVAITPASDFVSTSTSSSDWLKVDPAGALADGGVATTITDNTAGVRGNERPHAGTEYSIGADEAPGTQRPGTQAKQVQLNSLFTQNLDVTTKNVQQLAEAVDQLNVLADPELPISDLTEVGADQDGTARMAINDILVVLRAHGLIDDGSSSSA